MVRFFKSTAFRIFAVVLAALLAGSALSVVSRSGSSPLTKAVSVVFSPVSRLTSAITNELKGLPISFSSSSSLKKQNEELQKEIDDLREQLVDYDEVVYKNEFYKEFLELKEENSDYEFAEAEVIGSDASDRFGTITLSKGSSSGIAVNDPVIYGKYLVGVVVSVTPTRCVVNTLMNPDVNVSVYETRTREVSYVSTTVALAGNGQCRMNGLSEDTAITDGGIICTAGIGGIYPADLLVGTVVNVEDATMDISASAIIEPFVDYSQLTDVFVITSFDGQAE